jgi:coproporphyrinogen III oxidase-like Fe-S oxidoreductase
VLHRRRHAQPVFAVRPSTGCWAASGAAAAAGRADCEITLEANPGTFERDRFRAFRAAGVTRLSVGCRASTDGFLQAHRGRRARPAQALAAVEEAAQRASTRSTST